MTTLPAALQTHLDTGETTLGHVLKITRTDLTVLGFTSASRSVTINGQLYDAAQGLMISSIASSAGLGVDNLELTTIDDGTLFTRAQILGGVWQNAAFVLSRYNWASPGDGIEPLLGGTFGNVGLRDGGIVIELRGLQQYLQQTVGNVTTRTCRARFADYPTPNGKNLCRLDPAPHLRTKTVSGVTSRQVFTSAGLWTSDPVADRFGNGVLIWNAGSANAGMRAKVRSYVASGVLTLVQPTVDPIVNGDSFTIIVGCRGRLMEDCKTKHNNVLNFQGEPHLPGVDQLTANPDVSV